MRVVHESADGGREVLATDVETADTTLAQLVGLRFRHELPEDYALVFEFDRLRRGITDMLFVYVPLDVVWLRAGAVIRVETLLPWRGLAYTNADGFVEFPAGTASDVTPGDRLLADDDSDIEAAHPTSVEEGGTFDGGPDPVSSVEDGEN